MRLVEIVHVPARGRFGYKWRWRSEDRATRSERSFDLYYECVEDARAHGYEVKRPPTPPDLLTPSLSKRL
jgi:hypothetical protein